MVNLCNVLVLAFLIGRWLDQITNQDLLEQVANYQDDSNYGKILWSRYVYDPWIIECMEHEEYIIIFSQTGLKQYISNIIDDRGKRVRNRDLTLSL